MGRSPFKADVLQSRVALITGGGTGIGFEISRQLGLHGCKVVIMGRRPAFIDEAVSLLRKEGIQAAGVAGDVRSAEDAERAVAFTVSTFKSLDILVNGAAGNFLATAEALRPKGFKTVMEIDAVGTFQMSRAAFQALRASASGGVILNISATLHYGATHYQAHASAAKAAVDSLTRSLGLEWGRFGIRTVGIAPGPIADTPGLTKLAPSDDTEGVADVLKEMVPIGRAGRKLDIALAAVFLCSEAASFITCETLVVDGGHWLFRPPMIDRDVIADLSKSVEAKSRALGPESGRARSKL